MGSKIIREYNMYIISICMSIYIGLCMSIYSYACVFICMSISIYVSACVTILSNRIHQPSTSAMTIGPFPPPASRGAFAVHAGAVRRGEGASTLPGTGSQVFTKATAKCSNLPSPDTGLGAYVGAKLVSFLLQEGHGSNVSMVVNECE